MMLFVIITATLAGILSVESTENIRCLRAKLDFSGLQRGRENWYEDGHLFQIACEAGYQINDEAEVKCLEGEWTANVPPCTPVDCAEPPTIPSANLEKTSTTHGSYAIYAFQDPYKLIGHVRVQCLFGEWISMPRCNDGSCDLNNLTHSNEISREETPHYANSGQRLRVICKAGYSPSRLVRPYCSAGKWRRNFESPCKKDNCFVPKVKSGYIVEKVYGDYYWNFWTAKYVQEIINAKVPYGTLVKPNATYYLHCDSGYSYQGSSETEKRLTCIESYWNPEPVCIPRSSGAAELKNDVTTPVPQKVTCEKPLPSERGSVQFSDGQAVGSLATYLCEEGTTLVGVSVSKCLETGNWTFDPPNCLTAEGGINIHVYPERQSIRQGRTVVFRCRDVMRRSPVKWIRADNRAMPPGSIDRGGSVRMPNIQPEHSGVYICTSATASPSSTSSAQKAAFLIVQPYNVADKVICGPPPDIEEATVPDLDDEEHAIGTEIRYQCNLGYVSRIPGGYKSVCKLDETTRKAEWTKPEVSCSHYVSCNKFENSEHLNVVYSNGVNVGSIAKFSCVFPYTLVGSLLASCLQNGTWNSTLPSCEVSMCSIENLLLSLPENVLPDLRDLTDDYVPHGTEIQFLCDSNSFVSGSPKAKCGRGGGWEFGVVRCIRRCVLGEISPQLRVEPIQEYYVLGDSVTFSCPLGQKLSSEVRRVMCLGTSWSHPIPDCVEDVYWGK